MSLTTVDKHETVPPTIACSGGWRRPRPSYPRPQGRWPRDRRSAEGHRGHRLPERSPCARDHFLPGTAAADSLISPGRFARRLIQVRIQVRNRVSPLPAELVEAVAFRGLCEPQFDLYGYQRNVAHQQRWEADPAVCMVHQPLRYRVLRAPYSVDPAGAQVQPEVDVTENGVDVLCALAVVEPAARPDVDLVVLASHDHDLDPAVAAVQRSRSARGEGFQWFGAQASR